MSNVVHRSSSNKIKNRDQIRNKHQDQIKILRKKNGQQMLSSASTGSSATAAAATSSSTRATSPGARVPSSGTSAALHAAPASAAVSKAAVAAAAVANAWGAGKKVATTQANAGSKPRLVSEEAEGRGSKRGGSGNKEKRYRWTDNEGNGGRMGKGVVLKLSAGGVKHRREPTRAVCRRNERERNRVKQVNLSFERLRRHVPCPPPEEDDKNKNKKLSKVDTLRSAAAYIKLLEECIKAADNLIASTSNPFVTHSPKYSLPPSLMHTALPSTVNNPPSLYTPSSLSSHSLSPSALPFLSITPSSLSPSSVPSTISAFSVLRPAIPPSVFSFPTHSFPSTPPSSPPTLPNYSHLQEESTTNPSLPISTNHLLSHTILTLSDNNIASLSPVSQLSPPSSCSSFFPPPSPYSSPVLPPTASFSDLSSPSSYYSIPPASSVTESNQGLLTSLRTQPPTSAILTSPMTSTLWSNYLDVPTDSTMTVEDINREYFVSSSTASLVAQTVESSNNMPTTVANETESLLMALDTPLFDRQQFQLQLQLQHHEIQQQQQQQNLQLQQNQQQFQQHYQLLQQQLPQQQQQYQQPQPPAISFLEDLENSLSSSSRSFTTSSSDLPSLCRSFPEAERVFQSSDYNVDCATAGEIETLCGASFGLPQEGSLILEQLQCFNSEEGADWEGGREGERKGDWKREDNELRESLRELTAWLMLS